MTDCSITVYRPTGDGGESAEEFDSVDELIGYLLWTGELEPSGEAAFRARAEMMRAASEKTGTDLAVEGEALREGGYLVWPPKEHCRMTTRRNFLPWQRITPDAESITLGPFQLTRKRCGWANGYQFRMTLDRGWRNWVGFEFEARNARSKT